MNRYLAQSLSYCRKFASRLHSKKIVGTLAIVMLIALYPLSALWHEKIDRTEDYDLSNTSHLRSQGLEAISLLINREVNEHIWTPNLPFFFPAYMLDNMPNFQTGIIRSLAELTASFERCVQCPENHLEKAAHLLKYPPDIWLFAPDNKLKTAPSSSAQYRKALKYIKKFNLALEEEKCFWVRDAATFTIITNATVKSLSRIARKIEDEIREGDNSIFDNHADDVFYTSQGQIYAYMIILQKIGRDYKQVLMAKDCYSEWTSMLRALNNAVHINPVITINGKPDDITAPNHLFYMGYYVVKAENILRKLNYKITGETNEN
ncbi:MAG: DUF2333 family protein [Alphaproteobacteria bacterium]|nr:DUF2333 family protein [Alphaproteobacteria bacterium]